MSEYDNNQNENNEENKNIGETPEQNNVNDSSADNNDFRQSSESANQNNGYPYNNYNAQPQNGNPYGAQNQGNSYYGQYNNRKTNYVYYGNSQQPQQPPYGSNYNSYTSGPHEYKNEYNNQPPVKTKHSKKGTAVFVSCIAIIVVASIVLIAISLNGKLTTSSNNEKIDGPTLSTNSSSSAATTTSTGELTAAGVYEKVKESSVGVLVYSANTTTAVSEGTGVIVGEDDAGKYTYIITCAHVVSSGGTIKVQLFDETQYDATLIGADSKTDIAVMRISASGLSVAEMGDSNQLTVGETVYAIGNPGGVDFAGSFTNGMVSAIARPINSEIGYEMNCIQHTAAINPGNSGGALVNGAGQVIGINSSKIANTNYEGMGFAVPSSTFIDVYNEIMENGYVTNRPKLGITYSPSSASQSYSMLVSMKGLPAGSLIVKSIDSDSSLANGNVQVGDLIIKVNGAELDSADALPDLIEKSNVGDKMTLTVCHVDSNYQITEFEVEATLVEDKGTTTKAAEETTTQSYYYNPFGAYGYGN